MRQKEFLKRLKELSNTHEGFLKARGIQASPGYNEVIEREIKAIEQKVLDLWKEFFVKEASRKEK